MTAARRTNPSLVQGREDATPDDTAIEDGSNTPRCLLLCRDRARLTTTSVESVRRSA